MMVCSYLVLFQTIWLTLWRFNMREERQEARLSTPCSLHPYQPAEVLPGVAETSEYQSCLPNFLPLLLLRRTGKAAFRTGCVAAYQQGTVRHQSLLEFCAPGEGESSGIIEFTTMSCSEGYGKNRSCLALREKLLNSLVVKKL